MGPNIRSSKKGTKVSQVHLLVILKCKSENFPGHGGRHLKKLPNQCLEIWKDLSLRLMVKKFQRSSQVQFPSC